MGRPEVVEALQRVENNQVAIGIEGRPGAAATGQLPEGQTLDSMTQAVVELAAAQAAAFPVSEAVLPEARWQSKESPQLTRDAQTHLNCSEGVAA